MQKTRPTPHNEEAAALRFGTMSKAIVSILVLVGGQGRWGVASAPSVRLL